MARPRLYEETRVATAVRLPVAVHRRLHETASARAVSANLLVTRALEEFLDHLAPVEETLAVPPATEQGPLRRSDGSP